MLTRESTAHAFLRTIHTSKTKSGDFYASHVKSLFICPDLDPIDVVTLLSTCRGLENLSYWPLIHIGNSSSHSPSSSGNWTRPDPWQRRTPTPPLHSHRRDTRAQISNFVNSVALHNMEHLSPRKLSLVLSETHPIATFRPSFDSPFYASATHLTIANGWEEWTAWAGGAISSFAIPHLTHVKLDLAVGQAPPEDVSRSRARWLSTVTDGYSSAEESCPSDEEKEALSAWTRKIARVAQSIADLLMHTPALETCILVLRFDSNPARTARQISRLVSARISEYHRNGFVDLSMPPAQGAADDPGFDARLVFAWEREPFRYSHAHSSHENAMWRSAENVVKTQRHMSGEHLCHSATSFHFLISLPRVHCSELRLSELTSCRSIF